MTLTINSIEELKDPTVVRALLNAGEGQTLEFKTRLPDRVSLQRLLASFFNADGGLLIVGYDEGTGKVVGIDNIDRFIHAVEAALQLLPSSPGLTQIGGFQHENAWLGAVLLWPHAPEPLQIDGAYYVRRGDRTVKYDGERPNRIVVETATDSSATSLALTTGQIDRFLAEASEDILTDLVVVPLLRTLGFAAVSRKGHSDRSLEFGQDLRGIKYQLPTGHWLYFAAQIKSGTIAYSPAKPDSIDKIVEQLRMALATKMMDWDTRSEHRPDHVFLVASGQIVEGARLYLRGKICDDHMRVLFWDRDHLTAFCTTRGLPEPIQRDIELYLESAKSTSD